MSDCVRLCAWNKPNREILLVRTFENRAMITTTENLASISEQILFGAVAPSDDALSNLFTYYCNWVGGLNPALFLLVVRCALILGLATAVSAWMFQQGNRDPLRQAFILFNAVFLAFACPIHRVTPQNLELKAWFFSICLFLTATLPVVLPFFTLPQADHQRRMCKITYVVLLVLFVGTLLRNSSSWKP